MYSASFLSLCHCSVLFLPAIFSMLSLLLRLQPLSPVGTGDSSPTFFLRFVHQCGRSCLHKRFSRRECFKSASPVRSGNDESTGTGDSLFFLFFSLAFLRPCPPLVGGPLRTDARLSRKNIYCVDSLFLSGYLFYGRVEATILWADVKKYLVKYCLMQLQNRDLGQIVRARS